MRLSILKCDKMISPLKRAILYIKRKYINNLFTLIMITMMFIVFICLNVFIDAVSVNTDHILKNIPAKVTVEHRNDLDEYKNEDMVTLDKVRQLVDDASNIIKSYDYSIEQMVSLKETIKPTGENVQLENPLLFSQTQFTNMNTLIGVENPNFSLLQTGEFELSSGRLFESNELENGSNVLIISEDFAKVNDLELGGFIDVAYQVTTLDTTVSDIQLELKYEQVTSYQVIGMFKNSAVNQNTRKIQNSNADLRLATILNQLYVPNRSIENNLHQINLSNPELNYQSSTQFHNNVMFILTDYKDIETFNELASNIFPNETYSVKAITNYLEETQAPLIAIKSNIAQYLQIMPVLFILLLILVNVYNLHTRKEEFQVYLFLGENSLKTLRQRIVEKSISFLMALVLSIGFAKLIITYVHLKIPISQIQLSVEQFDSGNPFTLESIVNSIHYDVNFQQIGKLLIFSTTTFLILVLIDYVYIKKRLKH